MCQTFEEIQYQRGQKFKTILPAEPARRPVLTALGCITVLVLIGTLAIFLLYITSPTVDQETALHPWKIKEWLAVTVIAVGAVAFGLFIWTMIWVGRERP